MEANYVVVNTQTIYRSTYFCRSRT